MAFSRLLKRMQQGLSDPAFELVHTPHPRWPLPQTHLKASTQQPLKLLVLDSSFNPPTIAHLALANIYQPHHVRVDASEAGYDAELLLLSVRNADKQLKPGDASYLQRLEMMELLCHNVAASADAPAANVAIAIIDEPTFVGKSRILRRVLKTRLQGLESTADEVQLTFLLGFDTLERLVAPRYYGSEHDMLFALRRFFAPPPDGDDCRVICARRGVDPSHKASEVEKEKLGLAQEFIATGRIVLVDIPEETRRVSSTSVRDAISERGLAFDGWKRLVPGNVAEYIEKKKLYECH